MPPPAYAVERRKSEKEDEGLLSFLMCGDCCSPQSSSNKPPDYYSMHQGNRSMALPLSGVKLRHASTGADVQDYRRQEMEAQNKFRKSPPGVAAQHSALFEPPPVNSNQSPAQMYQQPMRAASPPSPLTYSTRSPNGIEPRDSRGGYDPFASRPSTMHESPGAVNPISWQQRTANALTTNQSEPRVVTLTPEALRQRRAEERRMELERMSGEEAANSLSPDELRRRRAEQKRQMELERMSAEEDVNSLSPDELRRRRAEETRRMEMERMAAEEAANTPSPDELRRRRAEERLRVLKSAENTLKALSPDDKRLERQTIANRPSDMHNTDCLASPPETIKGPIQRIDRELSPRRNPEPQVIDRKYPGTHTTITPEYGAPGSIINASNRSPTQLFQTPGQPARSSQSPSPAATRTAPPPPAATRATPPPPAATRASPPPSATTAMDTNRSTPMSTQTEALQQATALPTVSSSTRSPTQLFQGSAVQAEPRRMSPSTTQTDSAPMAPSAYLASLNTGNPSPRPYSPRASPPQYIQTGPGAGSSAVSNGTRAPAQVYQHPSISPRPEPSKYAVSSNSINSSNRSPTQMFAGSEPTRSAPPRPQAEERRPMPDGVPASSISSSTRSPTQLFAGNPSQSPPSRPQAEERRYMGDTTQARPPAPSAQPLSASTQGAILDQSNRSPTQLFQGPAPSQPSKGSATSDPPLTAAEVERGKVPVLLMKELNAAAGGASSEENTPRETSEDDWDSRASPPPIVYEIESCVMLPCCKSKVPRSKVMKTVTETEVCPCCGTQGIHHSMLIPINQRAITDKTAMILPCCYSQVPKKHTDRIFSFTSDCPVCFEPNIYIKDLQEINPVEVSLSKEAPTFDLPPDTLSRTASGLSRTSSAGSLGAKKKKVKKKSSKNRKVSSVYQDVGPGVKFFTDEEIQQMTAAQKKAIRDARRKSQEHGGPEQGWDQMSLNFVSELLMKDAKRMENDPHDQTVEDITNQNPLWGFQHRSVDAAPPPSFMERQTSFNQHHSGESSGPATPGGNFGRNFILSGAGGSGKIRSYNEVMEEEKLKRSPSTGPKAEKKEEQEGWMDISLSFVSDLLNADAKQKQAGSPH